MATDVVLHLITLVVEKGVIVETIGLSSFNAGHVRMVHGACSASSFTTSLATEQRTTSLQRVSCEVMDLYASSKYINLLVDSSNNVKKALVSSLQRSLKIVTAGVKKVLLWHRLKKGSPCQQKNTA